MTVLSAVRADRWLAHPARWTGAILMLHRVRPALSDPFQPNAHLEITPSYLDFTLGRLAEMKVPVVGPEEALQRLRSSDGERFAMMTFDDGYEDNFTHALPILRRHRAPFTVFVASGMVDASASVWWMTLEEVLRHRERVAIQEGGRRQTWDTATPAAKRRAFHRLAVRLKGLGEERRTAFAQAFAADHGVDIAALLRREMMSWDQVRALASAPGATIGGHTVDHPLLPELSDAEARREIRTGLDRIEEETGRRPRTFAYPFGGATARDGILAAELGMEMAVTTQPGVLYQGGEPDPMHLPRLSLNGHFQTSRALDLLLSGVPFLMTGAATSQGRAGARSARGGAWRSAIVPDEI